MLQLLKEMDLELEEVLFLLACIIQALVKSNLPSESRSDANCMIIRTLLGEPTEIKYDA